MIRSNEVRLKKVRERTYSDREDKEAVCELIEERVGAIDKSSRFFVFPDNIRYQTSGCVEQNSQANSLDSGKGIDYPPDAFRLIEELRKRS